MMIRIKGKTQASPQTRPVKMPRRADRRNVYPCLDTLFSPTTYLHLHHTFSLPPSIHDHPPFPSPSTTTRLLNIRQQSMFFLPFVNRVENCSVISDPEPGNQERVRARDDQSRGTVGFPAPVRCQC